MKQLVGLGWLLAALSLSNFATAAEFFLRDGDRVVFLGDSITEQRLYTTYIEAYTLARFPQWRIQFRNAGWNGDTAAGGLARAKRDVLPLRPTVVTIKFGMNDHGYRAFDAERFQKYTTSQSELVTVLQTNGARVALLTPQPVEERRLHLDEHFSNQSLRKFGDGLREIAARQGALYVNLFDPYMAIMLREHAADTNCFVGAGDAIHPGPPGHLILAWSALKDLGVPAFLSAVTVDAAAGKVVSAHGCKISQVKIADGIVRFDRLDEALPLPVDARTAPALALAPVIEELSRYTLQVTGLTAARYTLTMDDIPAGQFTREQLGAGVNLTAAPGPIAAQSKKLLDLIIEKNNLFHTRWRAVQLYAFPPWANGPAVEAKRRAEQTRLDRQIVALERQIDAARQPQRRHWELRPVAESRALF